MNSEFQFITDFRDDGVLHIEVVTYALDMQYAVLEVLRDFEEEVEERRCYTAPEWKFTSRRQKPRQPLITDLGNTVVAHNDDLLVLFDRNVPSLIDVYVRSPAGLRTAHGTLLELVQCGYLE